MWVSRFRCFSRAVVSVFVVAIERNPDLCFSPLVKSSMMLTSLDSILVSVFVIRSTFWYCWSSLWIFGVDIPAPAEVVRSDSFSNVCRGLFADCKA